jgi:hypothetical protein
MNKNHILKISIILILLILFVILLIQIIPLKNTYELENNQLEFSKKQIGTMENGDVIIEFDPKIIDDNLVVTYSINTHSVDLSKFDLKEITILKYDNQVIKPKKSILLSGHHSNGEIFFEIDKDIKHFKIIIKDIPKMKKRIFEW